MKIIILPAFQFLLNVNHIKAALCQIIRLSQPDQFTGNVRLAKVAYTFRSKGQHTALLQLC